MIWWFAIFLTVLINFMTISVLCTINFEMVQNIGNKTFPVSRMVILQNGKNASFSCKITDLEIRNNFEKEVIWGKKTKGLRFNNVLHSSTLNFTPITLKDRGIYFCASLKHSLYQTIYIAVETPDGFNTTSENRWKRENGNLPTLSVNHYVSNKNPVIATMSPDLVRAMKKKVFRYDTKHYGHESFSDRLREYARVIAPLVAVTLIISTLLYYMMKKFYLCATFRTRNAKTEVGCLHSTCGHQCMLPNKNNVPAGGKSQVNQESDTSAKNNEDTIIFLPFLFDLK